MNEIYLHNTLTGREELFKPLKGNEVRLYVCGVTPYDEAHLGHGRCYVVFDLLKRVLTKNGYQVRHIQNFTDVDDKIIDRANQAKQNPLTYAEIFIKSYHRWMKELNIIPADQYPRVTEHIPEILELIKKLISKGVAYPVDGDVFYSVRKFPDYGKLSKRKLDELTSGARVEVNERKTDPLDFALWKKAKPGEPAWDSPWGQGRPGWHIECSAMSMKFLGEDFDIHGGGLDLIFPHHENEIAQSVGATGRGFAHTWIHNGFVTINQEKMSKSLGNFFTLKDILSKYDPMTVRYFLLTQHYRSPLNFSDKGLKAADTVWRDRISEAAHLQDENKISKSETAEAQAEANQLLVKFSDALRNDLNTAEALGCLNQVVSLVFKFKAETGIQKVLHEMLDVLGLVVKVDDIQDPEALKLLADREKARVKKDWVASDHLRNELKAKGYLIEDTSRGSRLKKIK